MIMPAVPSSTPSDLLISVSTEKPICSGPLTKGLPGSRVGAGLPAGPKEALALRPGREGAGRNGGRQQTGGRVRAAQPK